MDLVSVYTYGVEMITKFTWESGFLEGSMKPSALTGVQVPYAIMCL